MISDFLAYRRDRKRAAKLIPRWRVRYIREDGHYREISLRAEDEQDAVTLAQQRHGEQFDDQQDYKIVSVTKA